ncbi:hypothetical protein BDV59DRAFT_182142 [Aspergillus ambiguus]|uniref:uncharacterized protein n=1 Tax=Aspergillus ambiguus TaxID=176160 RepID=UPI003CCDD399
MGIDVLLHGVRYVILEKPTTPASERRGDGWVRSLEGARLFQKSRILADAGGSSISEKRGGSQMNRMRPLGLPVSSELHHHTIKLILERACRKRMRMVPTSQPRPERPVLTDRSLSCASQVTIAKSKRIWWRAY